VELLTAIVTLFLVMDPVGNVPVFVALLKDVEPRRQVYVVGRECVIALAILMVFLLFGPALLDMLHIQRPSLHIASGVLLFLISLGMIFPELHGPATVPEKRGDGEPFIVPLATPLVAGPSTVATLMIFVSRHPERFWTWLAALVVAWALTAVILLLAPALSRLLGRRGLLACERLMGMVLVVLAVQMFLDGLGLFLATVGLHEAAQSGILNPSAAVWPAAG
jgi:multiple antibiotic resistance protein